MTGPGDPRPDPDSEAAGETEYGNDTGFAAAATAAPAGGGSAPAGREPAGTGREPAGAGSEPAGAGEPAGGPAGVEDADDTDPGRGAD